MDTSLDSLIERLVPGRPLLMVDADEVLLRFVERLERHLTGKGYQLRLTSYRLSGNIFHLESGARASMETCKDLIAGFFDECVDDVPAVHHAAETLAGLSAHYQILVLSNVPAHCRERRQASLVALGFDYPLVANAGDKGPAARRLADAAGARTIFVDDLPPQLASVADHAPHVHLVHFVADPRLARLLAPAEAAHARFDDWPALGRHLMALLES